MLPAVRGAGPQCGDRGACSPRSEELGYRADRTAGLLAPRRCRLLGVTTTVRNAFHAELVEGVQEVAEDAGHEVVPAGAGGALPAVEGSSGRHR